MYINTKRRTCKSEYRENIEENIERKYRYITIYRSRRKKEEAKESEEKTGNNKGSSYCCYCRCCRCVVVDCCRYEANTWLAYSRTDKIRRAKQVTRVDGIVKNECKLIRAKNYVLFLWNRFEEKFFDLKVVPFARVLVGDIDCGTIDVRSGERAFLALLTKLTSW